MRSAGTRTHSAGCRHASDTVESLGQAQEKSELSPLVKLCEHASGEYIDYRTSLNPNSDVFLLTDKGKPMTARALYTLVTTALQPLDQYSQKSPHVLRHSFATAPQSQRRPNECQRVARTRGDEHHIHIYTYDIRRTQKGIQCPPTSEDKGGEK